MKKGNELIGLTLSDGPRLIIGWRNSNKELEGYRVHILASELTEILANLCIPSLVKIRNYEERPWENFAGLNEEEYFWFPHRLLIKTKRSSKANGTKADHPLATENTAELLKMIQKADDWPYADLSKIAEGKFTFYAICWNVGDKIIGFVSHLNPVSTLKSGLKYFQYGNTLTTVEVPDFALRGDSDLIVGLTGTAIFNKSAFISLVGDVGIPFADVTQDIANLSGALLGSINLSTKAQESLSSKSSKTQKYARRLKLLPARLQTIKLDIRLIKRILKKYGIDHEILIDNNEFSFEEKEVGIFFDILESRYFKDDFSPEERKADRFSTRQ